MTKRYALTLISLTIILGACSEPAPTVESKVADKTLAKIESWIEDGMYSTREQVLREAEENVPDELRHNEMYQLFKRVEIEGFEGLNYFQQGSSDGTVETTFRAGILQFVVDKENDVVRQRELNFRDVQAFVDAYKDPAKIVGITMSDMAHDPGCDFHLRLKEDESEIRGPMLDGMCRLPPEQFGQVLIAEDEVVIKPGEFWFLGRYLNEAGEVMWGNASDELNKMTLETPLEQLSAASDLEVTIETGTLRGTREDGVRSFKNIPYAAPPIGRLRWQPPQAAEPWSGVRSAEDYGATCAQRNAETLWFKLPKISEDCLTVNVWTPASDASAKLPVMVSIHGGGFMQGSGNVDRQNGHHLAKEGVVLVTINYRLAAFGFLTHPSLAAMNPDQPQGNYGHMDAAAALKWVNRNIATFGGDPDNVTIFGTSAGGDTVNTLMIMPDAQGLFHKAIAQSASTGIVMASYTDKLSGFNPPTDKIGEGFAKRLIPEGTENVGEALYALSTMEIVEAMTEMDRFPSVIDGKVLPDQFGTLFSTGKHAKVPYITGSNSFEAALGYQVGGNSFSPQMFAKLVPVADKERLYAGLEQKQMEDEIFSDIIMGSNARHIATNMKNADMPVYSYRLSYILDARKEKQPGTAHADDVAYVMRTLASELDITEEDVTDKDREVSELFSSYWLQFAKTGNPNGEGLPVWPEWSAEAPTVLEIGEDVQVRENFLDDRYDYHHDRAIKLLDRMTKK